MPRYSKDTKKTCDVCQKVVSARGLTMHKRMAHSALARKVPQAAAQGHAEPVRALSQPKSPDPDFDAFMDELVANIKAAREAKAGESHATGSQVSLRSGHDILQALSRLTQVACHRGVRYADLKAIMAESYATVQTDPNNFDALLDVRVDSKIFT